MTVNVSFFQELLTTVADQGRLLLPKSLFGAAPDDTIESLVRALMSGRGEASGVAIARQLLNTYRALGPDARRQFFRFLADEIKPDSGAVEAAAADYLNDRGEAALARLQAAVESPRQEFFRRLNLAPGATAEIVALRRDLLRQRQNDMTVQAVDADLKRLLQSWFNRGFLVLRRIDWQTPAAILDKIIKYEAVHEIKGWDDLRRRLEPADRRCFAFFHPSLVDDPLIFVEVALCQDSPEAIADLLSAGDAETRSAEPAVAAFYSISNCQDGLKGISFGNFLLKQVVEELAREQPSLKSFVTLSPVPQFARWLDRVLADDKAGIVTEDDRVLLEAMKDPRWHKSPDDKDRLRATVLALAAHYFLVAKSKDDRPVDNVARFHLGNGAKLDRINWLGDVSEKGLREAHGLMVNYRYDLKEIERNHESYANDGTISASRTVRGLLRAQPKVKAVGDTKALPPPAVAVAIKPAEAGGR